MARTLEEVATKYVEEDWAHCPRCGSDQIEGHDHDYEGNEVSQRVTCTDCDFEWTDWYLLHRITVDQEFVNMDDMTLKEAMDG